MERPDYFRTVLRFFRAPKGILLAILGVVVGLAVPVEGARLVLPGVLAAVATAAALDVAFVRTVRGSWIFPSGAVLSGLIVAMVLSPHEPFFVPVAASAIAVASKRAFRLGSANVFNPAALALVAFAALFGSGHSWWGALPGVGLAGILALAASGIFIADRINKLPLVLAFLGGYFLLFTVSALLGNAADFVGHLPRSQPPRCHLLRVVHASTNLNKFAVVETSTANLPSPARHEPRERPTARRTNAHFLN